MAVVTLNITLNLETGDVQVGGIPLAETAAGERKVLKHLCYAALEAAKDAIRDLRPDKNTSPIAIASRIPNLNGGPR